MLSSLLSIIVLTLNNCCENCKIQVISYDTAYPLSSTITLSSLSDVPAGTDPATSHAGVRRQICDDIICNGFFYRTRTDLALAREIYSDLSHPTFSDVSHEIYTYTNNSMEYTNPYRPKQFILPTFRFTEYVFFCPFKDTFDLDDDEEPTGMHFFISKEYNVGPFSNHYMPGRFLMGSDPYNHDDIMVLLAEEPAVFYAEPGFNVELYYLRIRKYIRPGIFYFIY